MAYEISLFAAVVEERDTMRKALQEIADLCHSETRQRLLAIAQDALNFEANPRKPDWDAKLDAKTERGA